MNQTTNRSQPRERQPTPPALTLRPATLSDCLELAPRIRSEDRTEVELTEMTVEDCFRVAWNRGAVTEAICAADGTVIAVWGVVPLGVIASAWMLCTPEVEAISTSFLHAVRPSLDAAQAQFPRLGCLSWNGNVEHQQWLRRLGFFRTTVTHGDFSYFERHPLVAEADRAA